MLHVDLSTLELERAVEDNELPTTSGQNVLSDSVILSEETEHVYAVLEQTQPQHSPSVIQLDETTEQDQHSHVILESISNSGFQYVTGQMGQKSQSATWTSAQQSMLGAKPKIKNLELVHIYDDVPIVREGRATANIDNGLSYYDMPTSLELVPKKSKNTTEGSVKG